MGMPAATTALGKAIEAEMITGAGPAVTTGEVLRAVAPSLALPAAVAGAVGAVTEVAIKAEERKRRQEREQDQQP